MIPAFPADYASILERIDRIDPLAYGATRNYLDGAVTYLSPYISRGVISTRQVLEHVLAKGYTVPQIESFVKELCWRDYFQRVQQHRNLLEAIRSEQTPVANREIPVAVREASTGIEGIDRAIRELYETGYMHNHSRMYTAALVCNLAQSHWLLPAQWMYYHLLDGDWASNACSWQWVAGANSSKKYFANQENINRYTRTAQTGTFLDRSYEELAVMKIPDELKGTKPLVLETRLPETGAIALDSALPTYIYNYYNLDPLWDREVAANRVLLLEPEFFAAYPVSEYCMEFVRGLAENIPGIQVYTGSFQSLVQVTGGGEIRYKEHPFNAHYTGTVVSRDWISEEITGYYPSFFAYWKQLEKQFGKKA